MRALKDNTPKGQVPRFVVDKTGKSERQKKKQQSTTARNSPQQPATASTPVTVLRDTIHSAFQTLARPAWFGLVKLACALLRLC